ncbi:MAG TPA: ribosome silencing factor [Gammaproteobacteria bacterium]|nr:ribosome silencing factor [Gammaproteobacteria bacterium]|tara:strand:+ start:1539 stop:1913 length:375 start_codon:yes stop_codon:yes gene_type:complete
MSVEVSPETLLKLVTASLGDGKAEDIRVLDVRGVTSITDYMVIASGRSVRQVKALVDRVIEAVRKKNIRPLGIEGANIGEWILIDYGDVVVHTMRPETRTFYQLEKLWDQSELGSDLATAKVDS